jgi:hypothetical protein
MHQRCCVADRRTMRLIARLQPASKPPATKPHIATASIVSLSGNLPSEQD